MKFLKLILVLGVLIAGCQNKSVKLPVLDVTGIQDTIYNNTQVWIFFERQGNDTVTKLNRNNTVSTTHWVFNIDRRLTLKQIVPHLQDLFAKREKPSLHQSEDPVYNYFSYVDTLSNRLSMVLFPNTEYITDTPFSYNSTGVTENNREALIRQSPSGIYLDSELTAADNIQKELLKLKDTSRLNVHLTFDKNLSYQDYMHLKAILQNVKNDSIYIDEKEYVLLN